MNAADKQLQGNLNNLINLNMTAISRIAKTSPNIKMHQQIEVEKKSYQDYIVKVIGDETKTAGSK